MLGLFKKEFTDELKGQIMDWAVKNGKSKMRQAELDAVVRDLLERILVPLKESVLNSCIDEEGLCNYAGNGMISQIDGILKEKNPERRTEKEDAMVQILEKYIGSKDDARMLGRNLVDVVRSFSYEEVSDADQYLLADAAHTVLHNADQHYVDIMKELEALQVMLFKNGSEVKPPERMDAVPVNRVKEYRDKWNSNLFLNNPNKREKGGNQAIRLSDLYIVPSYKYKKEACVEHDIKDLLMEVCSETKLDDRMLLILGQPGCGKSSLLTYFLETCGEALDREVLLYRFTDFKQLDWNRQDIVEQFLQCLSMTESDLHGKVLMLDGFDEVSVKQGEETIVRLKSGLANRGSIKNFSLVITCRDHYVRKDKLTCNYITLQPLNCAQVEQYYHTYNKLNHNTEELSVLAVLQEQSEVFGNPILLYMTLASGVHGGIDSNLVRIYDRIFDLDGNKGVYDVENYKEEAHRVWLSENKAKMHEASRRIALWMYQYNDGRGEISQEVYQAILSDLHMSEIDVNIGNFFFHCEGTDGAVISFVHRSIYEYFVADAIFAAVKSEVKNPIPEKRQEFIKHMVPFIFKGKLDQTIGEYLRYKFEQCVPERERGNLFLWLEDALQQAMINGFYRICYESAASLDIIVKIEVRCLANMLKLLESCSDWNGERFIWQGKSRGNLLFYLEHNTKSYHQVLWLKRFDLRGVDLSYADLSLADLSGADLRGANLQMTNLEFANLQGTLMSRKDYSAKVQEQMEARGVIFLDD